MKKDSRGVYNRFIKRALDCLLSLFLLIILSPVLAILAILVRINLGSPVIFRQERPGLQEKIFTLKKFRTMLPSQTRDGRIISDKERTELITQGVDVLSDEERLTKFGRFLRATSLDEIPELWNIFVGEMSFVGPRPLSTAYLPYYNDYEKHRHDVRPGLTGLAQVNGRNSVTWEDRFRYDVEYSKNVTFMNDIKILFKTVMVVLNHKDIGQGNDIPESFHVVRQKEWDSEKEK